MNANGECTDKYKRSVVSAYVHRALTHNQEWDGVDKELNRVRQLLTNNGYNGNLIEEVISQKISHFIEKKANNRTEKEKTITVYHQMSYGTQHEKEVEALKNIIRRGVDVQKPFEHLSLRIYCRPNTTSSLIMRNSTTEKRSLEETTNVVYEFKCPVDACKHRTITYIGLTTTTLRRRMLAHRNHGAIHNHFIKEHDRKPLLTELMENTSIRHRESENKRLKIAEAVSIAIQHPVLNVQKDSDYVLPSARKKTVTNRQNETPLQNEDVAIIDETQTRAPSRTRRGSERGRGNNASPRGSRYAPDTARRGDAASQPAEGSGDMERRALRPRRARPSYAE